MPMREQHISMMLYANQGTISSSPPTSLSFGSEWKFLCILLISLRQTTIEWEILSHPDYTVRSCCLSIFTPPTSFTSKLHLFIHRQSCGVNNNKLGLSKIIPLILSPRCRCCANSAWIPAITPCSNSRPPEPVSQPACTQSRLACEVMKNNVPLLLIPPTRI